MADETETQPQWLNKYGARVRVVGPTGLPEGVIIRDGRSVRHGSVPASAQLDRTGEIKAVNRETVTVVLDGDDRPRNFKHQDLAAE